MKLETAIAKYVQLVAGGHAVLVVKDDKLTFTFNTYDQETGELKEKKAYDFKVSDFQTMLSKAKLDLANLEVIDQVIKG